MAYYARILREKADRFAYLYGEHWAPHDIEQHELGPGTTRRDTALALGIRLGPSNLFPRARGGEPSPPHNNLDGILRFP